MSKINISWDKFGKLLKELDEMLAEREINIEIKAIGGFSMIYHAQQHKIKGREESSDIDSLSKLDDYVIELISFIGMKNGVEEDWLNNDWLNAKKGNEELEYFAQWINVTEFDLKFIDLWVLDLETMFFFKMRALDEKIQSGTEAPRQQDIRDIYLILQIFNEHDMNNIKNAKMARCIPYFPAARDFMTGREPDAPDNK